MPQMQGGKGEAVVIYRKAFPTQQMGYHPAEAGRVNKIEKKVGELYLTHRWFININGGNHKRILLRSSNNPLNFIYAHSGLYYATRI